MNAGLLISPQTGTNGAQAVGQPAPDTTKAEIHSDDASFDQVLTQVGKQTDGSTDKTDAADASTPAAEATGLKDSKNSTDSTAALSPLQMVLALQASVLTAVQTGLSGDQGAEDGESTTMQSTDALLVTTVADAQQAARAAQAGSATAAATDAPTPAVSAATAIGSEAVVPATDKAGPTADPASTVQHQDLSIINQPDVADQAAADARGDLLKMTSDKASTEASDRSAGPEPVARGTDLQAQASIQAQGLASDRTEQAEASNRIPVVAGLDASGRGAEPHVPPDLALPRHGAEAKVETMAEANVNVGQPLQTLSQQNADQQAASPAQTGPQDWAMTEQMRQLAASGQADKNKESGRGQKEPPSSQSVTGAERLGIGTGDGRPGRIDGAAKVVAAAPVAALPTEPAGVSSVQSLRLEVERPDLGGVQVRVVLADQTVHAKVTTGQVEVRDFLVAKQDQLALGLKASGLEMGEFQVDVDPQGCGQSGPGWFAGAQGDQADQGRRQPEPPAAQPLFVEPRTEQWVGYGHGTFGGGLERRTLNVFA